MPFEAVLDVARDNAGSLVTLRVTWRTLHPPFVSRLLSIIEVDALLAAAPRLMTLECEVQGIPEQMLPLLRKEPPYAALCLSYARCQQSGDNMGNAVDVQPLLEAIAAHDGIRGLDFAHIPFTVQQLEATVDVAVQMRHSVLKLICCSLTTAHLPALTRLLTDCRSLECFFVSESGQPLIVGEGAPAFCAALRASSLTDVSLVSVRLWDSLPDGLAVLDALTGHHSLLHLSLVLNWDAPPASLPAIGHALGRLVAANSRLELLDLYNCSLGDASLRPLFEALSANRTLRSLDCRDYSISREFSRNVVLPAV